MMTTGTMRSEIHQNYSAQVPKYGHHCPFHIVTLIFIFTKVTGHFISGILFVQTCTAYGGFLHAGFSTDHTSSVALLFSMIAIIRFV